MSVSDSCLAWPALFVCVCVCVCVLVFNFLVGTRSPHKDSKSRNIRTSWDISPLTTRKKAILGLGVRFRVRATTMVRVRHSV